MTRAVLSLGSNLGDRLAHLRAAIETFSPWLVAVSSVYRTPPWGPVAQDDFYNLILVADDASAAPRDWLERAWAAEQHEGRTREVHWGARTLDVDVVDVDGLIDPDETLTLPHPYAHERAFVLVPWLEVEPDAVLPGRGVVRDLVSALPAAEIENVVRLAERVTS